MTGLLGGRSKLRSQRQFASVRGWAQCIAIVIASNTVGGSLGPFDHFLQTEEFRLALHLVSIIAITII